MRKQIFDFWRTGEQANLFQGNKGTGTAWEGLNNDLGFHIFYVQIKKNPQNERVPLFFAKM